MGWDEMGKEVKGTVDGLDWCNSPRAWIALAERQSRHSLGNITHPLVTS